MRYINNGVGTEYTIQGDGKPLLFLHGLIYNPTTYKKLINSLAETFTVIAPNIPGFGNSDCPKKVWNFENYSDYFSGFLNSLGYKNITVVGHSFGGGIAVYLAGNNMCISDVVLIDSAGIKEQRVLPLLIFCILKKTINQLLFCDFKTFVFLIKSAFIDFVMKRAMHIVHVYKITLECVYKSPEFITYNKPTLILWGNQDEMIPIKYGRELNKLIKGSTFKAVNGFHDWLLFTTTSAVSEIKGFIKNN